MIARAAAANALVLVPRGDGRARSARRCDGQLARGVYAPPRGTRDELRVDDVAVRREEARVARLQPQDLVAVVAARTARSLAATT